VSDERLKIAVFIDFDNIEIGVKTTLGGSFDVGAVLEAVKERGEVVSKVAYGDWTRATDYGRTMSQHAIHMVQRNLTPGGDKNGADINLALDALEMAFTHSHINAFVIVGGDSDFITLVEKLKQYDRKVFVVGGRSFTSHVMQKNCTEFIAYEDILGTTGRGRQSGSRTRALTDIAAALPLVRRAIKLLADREMTPQLGLLKSTLLQLDSSFSERAYGASSFRDFVEKLAKAGYVVVKGGDHSFYVELRETREAGEARAARESGKSREHREPGEAPEEQPRAAAHEARPAEAAEGGADEREAAEAPSAPAEGGPAEGTPAAGQADCYRLILQALSRPGASPRFPMYARQFKHFMKSFDESFDERRYGFAGILDALRFGQREGLLRLERDRRGGVRVYAGPQYQALTQSPEAPPDAAPLPADLPPQVTPPPVEAVSAAAPEVPPVEAQPLPAPQPVPAEAAEATAASEEAVPPSEPVPAEAAAPRRAPRKKAAPRAAAGRAKKTAAPAAKAPPKKKAARPRAKKTQE